MIRPAAPVAAAVLAASVVLAAGVALAAPAAAAAVPEPAWPAKCPLQVGLLLDQSASMDGSFDTVRSASSDLVDALRGQHTQVMLIGFGSQASVIQPLTDVSDADGRRRIKDAIDGLGAFDNASGNGGTNWDAALQLASHSGLQVVMVLTDGQPTAYGIPASGDSSPDDPKPLQAATDTANALKRAGARVVPVGIGLQQGGAANLSAISGTAQGNDYFVTDLSQLRRELYEIASKSCGIPVSALPTPEPPGFPLKLALIAVAATLGLAVIGGGIAARVRHGRSGAPVLSPPSGRLGGRRGPPPIRLDDVPPVVSAAQDGPVAPAPAPDPAPDPPSGGRSMSLDFLRKPDDGSGSEKGPDR